MRNSASWLAGVLTLSSAFPAAAADTAFFEQKIRPLFVEHCLKCHSGAEPKGGLSLETREGWAKGGKRGPAIRAGDPDASLLLQAVTGKHSELTMPPKGRRLNDGEIAALRTWIQAGAPDPRETGAGGFQPPLVTPEQVRTHWAFQPLQRPALPVVRQPDRVRTPVDQFVLVQLEAASLDWSEPADRRTLIRRLSLDLLGLPPGYEELEAIATDPAPDAMDRWIERLLASPLYGERWGRHWLDVARYADTAGYRAGGRQRRFSFSYTYRDYVIRAFNEDLPFSRFVEEQLAADLLPLGEDKRPLAALGFLTLGRKFLDSTPDIIDDRIDVVTRGLMGLTVHCARCHDHKYDPVPTADYYSLYGVFASCHEPEEQPLLGVEPPAGPHAEYLVEQARRERVAADYLRVESDKVRKEIRERTADYLAVVREFARSNDRREGMKLLQQRKLNAAAALRWKEFLDQPGNRSHAILGPWIQLSGLPADEFVRRAGELNGASSLNARVAAFFAGTAPKTVAELGQRYDALFRRAESGQAHSDAALEQVRLFLRGADSPAFVPEADSASLLGQGQRDRHNQHKAKVAELDATHPGAPPRAMVLLDNARPHSPHIFVRGQAGNRGPAVPRQFPALVDGPDRRPFAHGSGRLEMARKITDPANPLTSRVLVNRVWMHHFGRPLVDTPSDFGVRADPPSHPKLLDWLAAEFSSSGGSIKHLHRIILRSTTYQQASTDRPDGLARDPNNELLWKMNRQRLSFEAMRDTLMHVSGRLELRLEGQPVELEQQPFPARRTVYGYVDRQNLPATLRTFDFASPDATAPKRFETIVPQQALFLMNSPFVRELAERLVNRPEIAGAPDAEARVRQLYRVVLQRDPRAGELSDARQFLGGPDVPAARWAQFAQVLLLSNELLFVD